MACIAAYTGANTIFVEYKCAESHLSAWLQEVQVAHSSRHACFLCLSVHALNCPVSDGWTQSVSFLHIKELISGGLQGMYRGCCPRLLRCSFCTCMQLGNLSSTNISKQKYFLYSNSISCSPALVLFLPPPNTWRDFRARIVPALARKKSVYYTHHSSPEFSCSCHGLAPSKKLSTESLEQAATQVGVSVLRRAHCSSVQRMI